VQVEGAHRLRLHLAKADLPAGTRMWVYGRSDRPAEFGLELRGPEGDLWTPSVAGERLYFELQLPLREARRDAAVTLDRVLEIFHLTAANTSCLIDASCVGTSEFPSIDNARHAIAQLQFIKGGQGYLCSGGLLNDSKSDLIPYLLTANHCFSDQSAASSLDAFWDYFTQTCNGPFPNENTLPRSHGATLLATGMRGAESDFTLLRLNSIPGGRWLLGWNADPGVIAQGVVIFRVSHPAPAGFPFSQGYSKTIVNTSPAGCEGVLPRPTFIYSQAFAGDVFPGSSGAPVMLANGQVVGQLFGGCGPTAGNYPGCDASDAIVDGAFSATFPSVAPWLYPSAGPTCVADPTTACLLNKRFQATVRFRGDFTNNPADAQALVKPVSGFANANFETSFFYFNDPNNIELLLKMLDQGNQNAAGQLTIAVLFGSATPLRLELTIADKTTGAVRTYTSNAGTLAGAVDFTAFVK
jgi:lysyl endopeptidase